MNIFKTILSLGVLFLRIYVIIRVGFLLFTYFNNVNIEISREFMILICYMIFELYLFRSFENVEDVDIYNKNKENE